MRKLIALGISALAIAAIATAIFGASPLCRVWSHDRFAAHVAYCNVDKYAVCTAKQYSAACRKMFDYPGNATSLDGSVAWRADDPFFNKHPAPIDETNPKQETRY